MTLRASFVSPNGTIEVVVPKELNDESNEP